MSNTGIFSPERMIPGSPFSQGRNEFIARSITVSSSWGEPPFTSRSTKVYRADDLSDVTLATTTGATTSDGNVIVTPRIHSLTPNMTYRVEITFTTAAGNVVVIWFELQVEF